MKLFEFSTAVLVAALLSATAWDASAQVSVSESNSLAAAVAKPYQSINIEAPKLLERSTLYSPPDLVIPAAPATAPCRVALGAGFSIPWGGLGGNGSVEDEKCTMRENARIVDNCHTNACLAIMCSDANVNKAISRICQAARGDVQMAEAKSAPLSCPGYSGHDQVVRKRMGCE